MVARCEARYPIGCERSRIAAVMPEDVTLITQLSRLEGG
jgi:hypothetical protein